MGKISTPRELSLQTRDGKAIISWHLDLTATQNYPCISLPHNRVIHPPSVRWLLCLMNTRELCGGYWADVNLLA